jgi:hypothetical protein
MISELSFVRTYTTYWKSLFPGGDDYIRLINSALGAKFAEQIDIEDKPFRRALINNISFDFFMKQINKEISIKEIANLTIEDQSLKSSITKEIKALSNLRFGNKLSKSLSHEELMIVKTISIRLIDQYSRKSNLIMKPAFPGCGILFEANGDIYYQNTLVEVKAGQRNFSIQDIRQIYIYAALNHPNKKYEINKIELCNPRTGLLWRENINLVSENIAGASTIEIFTEIIGFISSDNHSL